MYICTCTTNIALQRSERNYEFICIFSSWIGENVTLNHVKRMKEQGLLRRNLKNPIRKDTVSVPDGGYVVLRFKADNPGKTS